MNEATAVVTGGSTGIGADDPNTAALSPPKRMARPAATRAQLCAYRNPMPSPESSVSVRQVLVPRSRNHVVSAPLPLSKGIIPLLKKGEKGKKRKKGCKKRMGKRSRNEREKMNGHIEQTQTREK